MPVGARLRIEYLDQNEAFAESLPTSGVVRRMLKTSDSSAWYLLDLDDPVEYIGNTYERIVVRSRWAGHELGETEPTSVFIALIRDSSLLDKDPTPVDNLELIAWGMSHTT